MKTPENPEIRAGAPAPLGARITGGGVNFAVFSKYAERMELLLFSTPEDPAPSCIIDLDPRRNRTHYYWHVFVPAVGHGQVYAWRAHGPDNPAEGHRFDGDKVLLDPYGKAVAGQGIYDRQAAREHGDNCARALRSVVVDTARYDWEGDRVLGQQSCRELIYELHVGGFTASLDSGIADDRRGTYAGLVDRIDHLVDLGVTTVELMPVHEFDPQDAPSGRRNTWGYSSVSWFAPHAGYGSTKDPAGVVDEFRDMVKALHRAGLRVVLDVVYNHTAEGDDGGPVISWRGLENSAYYLLSADDKSRYRDVTGCGNTVNTNHSIVRRLILDSLHYWVEEMHIDGFRFDLASVLSRGEDGEPLARPPVIWAIESSPILAGTRLIAEAWDAGGLFQLGSFVGDRFAQWNGRFRDDVRRFWRGDDDTIENLMARIVGSPDIFRQVGATPSQSVNYVASHDGFCLRDLFSYDEKHNEANGEDNRDGENRNLSWNCGYEGDTDDPEIAALRRRLTRNALVQLYLSHGTPMLLAGDEFGQTRNGNNNPWCQDNELNWLDWSLRKANADLLRFTRLLIDFASGLRILQEDRFWAATSPTRAGDITWHGAERNKPDWSPGSRLLAYTLEHASGDERVHVILNSGVEDITCDLPPTTPATRWRLVVDTARTSPDDIHPLASAPVWPADRMGVSSRSAVVFICHPPTA